MYTFTPYRLRNQRMSFPEGGRAVRVLCTAISSSSCGEHKVELNTTRRALFYAVVSTHLLNFDSALYSGCLHALHAKYPSPLVG